MVCRFQSSDQRKAVFLGDFCRWALDEVAFLPKKGFEEGFFLRA
jgi:hypothetical protein